MNIAFVFPGQGSQRLGMLSEFAGTETLVDTFAAASGVLGYDLWQVVQEGPRDKLNATECTQPAMLAAGVAMWRIWLDHGGLRPQAMAGHSLGEYTALVCSGAVEFEEAVALVQFRGRAMQEAVPTGSGAMAALLGLDDAAVEAACMQASSPEEVVEPVNYNAPGQVVIAGHSAAVGRAIDVARASGARRAIQLPVSVPSHSSLMYPAAELLRTRLANVELREPQIASVYTIGQRKHSDPDKMRDDLVTQLHSPVRWTDTVRAMLANDAVTQIVECGPGAVLSGLARRIDRRITAHAIYDPDTLQHALQAAEDDK